MMKKVFKWVSTAVFGVLLALLAGLLVAPAPFEPTMFELRSDIKVYESTPLEVVKKYPALKPEDVCVVGSFFYSGVATGSVLKINIETGQSETILTPGDFNPAAIEIEKKHRGEYCNGNPMRAKVCGQVLGIKYHADKNQLFLSNKKFGIYTYDIENKQLEKIVDTNRTSSGGIVEMYDDVFPGYGALDGKIYYSRPSDKWGSAGMFNAIWAGERSGSLMEFDLETREETELVPKNFKFSNGVIQVGNFLYVADTISMDVSKVDPKTGDILEVFPVDVYPDNIMYHEDSGNLYVSGLTRSKCPEWTSQHPRLLKTVSKHPVLLALYTLMCLDSSTGSFVEMDLETGGVKRQVFDPTGDVFKGISSIVRVDDTFFVGSFFQDEVSSFRIKN